MLENIGNIGFVIIGLAGLFFGGNWLVRGASNIALSFGISTLFIALTFVAIGTSMPEMLVSLQAALQGNSNLSIGNVIGSNIANIGLILGATGLIAPIKVQAVMIRREIPIMILFTIFTVIVTLDGVISRVDGLLLLFSFVGFNTMFYFLAKQEQDTAARLLADLDEPPEIKKLSRTTEVGYLIGGIALLVVGSGFMVEGAVNIARSAGVSDLVIAVTMVAFGTSLPELAASLSAAFQKESDLAIGNIVGSNIANLLLILGLTAFIQPINVNTSEVQFEFLIMIAFSVLLIPFVRHQQLGRRESALFLGSYFAFVLYTFRDVIL
jgi:cation:H+ antiporter